MTERKTFNKVGHDDKRTNIGTVDGNQGRDIENPIPTVAQSLVHQFGINIISFNGLVVILKIKQYDI